MNKIRRRSFYQSQLTEYQSEVASAESNKYHPARLLT